MEQFDKMLKDMAEQEECMVPEGFDGRLQETLGNLPSRTKKRGLGAVKGALIAAAVCVALVGTAFAASPGLREMLAEALGGFAPYAQEQDSDVYTWNGFEFKVLSALADENTVQVYVQARDLEGRGRLDIHNDIWVQEGLYFDLGGVKSSMEFVGSAGSGSGNLSYDETTQTAIMGVRETGILIGDLSEAKVRIDGLTGWMDDPWEPPVVIPVTDVKIMPSKTVITDVEVGGIQLEKIRISPLSIVLEWEKVGNNTYTQEELDLETAKISVKMKDGTVIKTEYDFSSGHGTYRIPGTGRLFRMFIWNFADPVDVDQAVGVYIGEDYFPIP